MCGRFERKNIEKELLSLFEGKQLKVIQENDIEKLNQEDIRPTQNILSVLLKKDVYYFSKAHWGIKFKADSPLIFNSRIETIKGKKYWNTLFEKNKCVVPMSCFFEWKTEGKKKNKYRIYLQNRKMFFVPALYYKDKDNNLNVSLITTTPNKFIETIHHRMPVILDLEDAIGFLNDDISKNLERCIPYDDKNEMEMEEV
jgi:putative SOS response-associated peptidase YedK